jgi:Dolichyl-phosphate-mannose-protein mannosyltransferase
LQYVKISYASIATWIRRIPLAPSVLIIAGISFLIHVLVGNNYGYFRDELYFMAASHNPAFGYVDVPPFVPWITIILRVTTGNALWAIHIVSALVCAGTILLTGNMARLLGGKGWVQGLAALGTATALVLIGTGSIYAYDVFDEFWWALAANVLIVIVRDERPQRWLLFGLVAGLGLLTKETILFWGFALVVGLLLTPQRRLLLTRWTIFGGMIAFGLLIPFILWNVANHWASIEYWASYSKNHSSSGSPIDFLVSQILVMNPFSILLWGAGLWYVFSARGECYRVFGWAYIILFILFALLQSKSYFLSPAYLPLFACGALQIQSWGPRFRRIASAYPYVLALSGLLLAPGVIPLLPPPNYGPLYGSLLGNSGAQQSAGDIHQLPQILADRFGWESQVAQIAQVYHRLPSEDQRIACIYTVNYGEGGALYQFGDRYHLPPPISGHNAFFTWGSHGCTGQVVVSIGITPQQAARWFNEVTLVATTSCDDCVQEEDNTPILVLRQPKVAFSIIWEQSKHLN